MKLKARLEGYLADAIRNVPEDERIIRDTGDGAAICFLGAPEAAMFAALALWQSLILDEQEQQPALRVRIGINLGPVRLVKDFNGDLNPLGDGMDIGQRIMSFAAENQILVSRSFFEVVSCLSDDYKALFTLKGVETDKHVREHTVYNLFPPGADRGQIPVGPVGEQTIRVPAPASRPSSPVPEKIPERAPESHPENKADAGSRPMRLLLAVAILVVILGASAWYLFRPAIPATPIGNAKTVEQGPLTAKQTITPVPSEPKENLPPTELFTLDNWIEFGWNRDGDAITRQGGEFVLAPPNLTRATVQFSVILVKGKRIEWVAGYRDAKTYDLFQIDETNFTRTGVANGKHGKAVTVPHQAKRESYNTFAVKITPRSIVHSILRDQQWTLLDDWQPAKGVTSGQFGFHIPGKDQISLSDFKIVQN